MTESPAIQPAESKSTSRMDWFSRIPRRSFRFGEWHYAAYILVGYAGAGWLHYRIWKRSSAVASVFSELQFDVSRFSPLDAASLLAAWGLIVAWLFFRLVRRLRSSFSGIELVFWGVAPSVSAAAVPWLFASSVTNSLFMLLFGMTAVAGLAVAERIAATGKRRRGERRFDPWKTLVHATKASVAILAVVVGVFATTILGPWRDSSVGRAEVLRYAILTAYLMIGLIVFVFMPLLARALEQGPTDSVDIEPPGIL